MSEQHQTETGVAHQDRGAVSPSAYLRRRLITTGTGFAGLVLGAVIIYLGVPDVVDIGIAIALFLLGTVIGVRLDRISRDMDSLARGRSRRA